MLPQQSKRARVVAKVRVFNSRAETCGEVADHLRAKKRSPGESSMNFGESEIGCDEANAFVYEAARRFASARVVDLVGAPVRDPEGRIDKHLAHFDGGCNSHRPL